MERHTARGFTVREQRGGKSSTSFSYRVVARRRDIDVPRFKKIDVAPDPQDHPQTPAESESGVAPDAQPRREDLATSDYLGACGAEIYVVRWSTIALASPSAPQMNVDLRRRSTGRPSA